MHPEHHHIHIGRDWNQPNRRVSSGLFLLHMAAQQDWIVRHDLSIELTSSSYAQQRYEVDIDMEEVVNRAPLNLQRADDQLIWLPVLRIPTIRPEDQRVVSAYSGTGDKVVPTLPQNEIRRRLAEGLTWLVLNRLTDLGGRPSSDRARVRNGVSRAIRSYLATGDHQLGTSGLETQLHNGDPRSDWRWLNDLFDPELAAAKWSSYSAGLAECIAYARYGYLSVVGIDLEDRYPHIQLNLLPAELVTRRFASVGNARQLLGFDAHRSSGWRHAVRGLWAQAVSPSIHHLRIPVPEVADLTAVHVELTSPEEVCISPAVLHHDGRWQGDGDVDAVAQARVRNDTRKQPAPSELSVLGNSLPPAVDGLGPDASDQLAAELRSIAARWERRATRLADVEALSQPAPPLDVRVRTRFRHLWDRDGLAGHEPEPSCEIRRRAVTLAGQLRLLANDLDREEDQAPVDLPARLEALVALEAGVPHIEMTGDDDLRDHVAHFRVNTTETVYRRATDSRPEVNAILRVSEEGRAGMVLNAGISCLISTGLLFGLWAALSRFGGLRYDPEAMVATLLLVPAISVALVERVPGGTMRHLVLGRVQQMTYFSLVAPVISAAIIGALFRTTNNGTSDPIGLGRAGELTVSRLLWYTGLFSLVPTLYVWWIHFRHKVGYNWGTSVNRLITYRSDLDVPSETTEHNDEVRLATVNRQRVSQLVRQALFQINQPHQRFMVMITIDRDTPNSFRHALEVLQDLPAELERLPEREPRRWHRLWRSPAQGQDPVSDRTAVIESSLVTSVATTGTVMSIVSQDLARAAEQIGPDAIQQIVADKLTDDVDEGGAFHVRVTRIVDDTQYFRYRPVTYQHYSFLRDTPSTDHRELLAALVELDEASNGDRTLSYLYLPIRPHPRDGGYDEERPGLRVGFAVADDGRPDDNLRIRLATIARDHGYTISSGRSVSDHPGSGRSYGGARLQPDPGLVPRMLVAAGPDDPAHSLGTALERIGANGGLVEGGTLLTNGGYMCRSLRLWATPAAHDRIERELTQASRSLDAALVGPNRGTGWYGRPSDIEDRFAGDAMPEPEWVVAWIRWRLDIGNGDGEHQAVMALLDALDDWAERNRHGGPWSVTFTNIEFLASHIRDRRLVAGKARYRIGVDRGTGLEGPQLSLDEVALRVHRSLEVELQEALVDRLSTGSRFVTVERSEPLDPRDLLPEPPA